MYMIVILCHELKLILSHFISFSYIYKSLKFHTTPSFDILLFVILMVAAYVFMTSFTSHIKDTLGFRTRCCCRVFRNTVRCSLRLPPPLQIESILRQISG